MQLAAEAASSRPVAGGGPANGATNDINRHLDCANTSENSAGDRINESEGTSASCGRHSPDDEKRANSNNQELEINNIYQSRAEGSQKKQLEERVNNRMDWPVGSVICSPSFRLARPPAASNLEIYKPEVKPQAAIPQRKRSVFSFNGFPSAQLLEQQNGVNKQQTNQLQMDLDPSPETLNNKQTSQPQNKQTPRRSTRSDTLGSTGSSRASSCDEPTIVSAGPLSRSIISGARQTSSRPEEASNQQQLRNRKESASSTSANNSSSCSLDSLASQQQVLAGDKQQAPIKSFSPINGDQASSINASKPPQVPLPGASRALPEAASDSNNQTTTTSPLGKPLAPFESIKTQIKRNSIPNAQLITRHIDKLISQNEAIVDNCNLVSIRSYNSSRPLQTLSSGGSELSGFSGAAASGEQVASAGSGRISKRWSTSAAPSQADLLLAASNSIETTPNNPLLVDGLSSNYFATTGNNKQLLLSRQAPERKRSYNLGSSSSLLSPRQTGSGRLFQFELQQQTKQAAILELTKQSSANKVLPKLEANSQEPLQLESGIQNLSLKRREDELLLFETTRQNCDINNKLAETHITALVSANKQPNLMLNQQQQHQDEALMAALLMERQRQSLASLSNLEASRQAAILHQQQQQQQMIEEQIKWNHQIAGSLNHHQPLNHHHQLASSSSASGAAMLAMAAAAVANQQELAAKKAAQLATFSQLREQQALESQMLKDFLNQMIPKPAGGSQQQLPVISSNAPEVGGSLCTHGREMLTQSLDNSIPAHRCEACDISFWTRDLLEYHVLTQCVGRSRDQLAKMPIAFTFGQNPASHLTNNQPASLWLNSASSSNPLASGPENANSLAATSAHLLSPLVSKSVSPPRRAHQSTSGAFDHLAQQQIAQQQQQQQQLQHQQQLQQSISHNSSILKQQLLTSQPEQLPHESLPFKKRKISEPNMRY